MCSSSAESARGAVSNGAGDAQDVSCHAPGFMRWCAHHVGSFDDDPDRAARVGWARTTISARFATLRLRQLRSIASTDSYRRWTERPCGSPEPVDTTPGG